MRHSFALQTVAFFCVVHEYNLWVLLGISKAESEEDFATKFKYDVFLSMGWFLWRGVQYSN